KWKKNPQLARGFHKGVAKLDARKEWDTIAEKCNSLGPPVRDGEGWLKVWGDFKFKVKKKVVLNKKESRATGGGINNQKSLSSMESAVANLMCFESMVNPPGASFGGAEKTNNSQISEELNETDEIVSEEDVEQENIEP
ncbi:myb-related transcription factor, partner of profilin-like, partial [Rhagoletis pomonella]|uniref:myb-related transcription factor, partner of profilin-like n=1 Tax=Rhagoletis pomonella TaxID=28610 RepID=UPI00177BCF37